MALSIIQNIVSVERIEAYHLASALPVIDRGIYVPAPLIWEPVCIIGMARLEVSDNVEHKERIFNSVLTFKTADPLIPGDKHYAWRLTTVSGGLYIIGLSFSPYPSVTNANTFPDQATERSGNTVTVSYSAIFPPLQVLG